MNILKDLAKNIDIKKLTENLKPLIDKEIPTIEDGTVKEKKKFFKLGFWDKRKLKTKPEISFLIKMYFSNGTSKEFVISTTNEVFKYKKRYYYLRYEDSWFNLTQNQYELNYFDDSPVPIDRKIVKSGNKNFWIVTPENLKPLIDMNYIKALASGEEMDKHLRMLTIIGVLSIFALLWVIYRLSAITKVLTVV